MTITFMKVLDEKSKLMPFFDVDGIPNKNYTFLGYLEKLKGIILMAFPATNFQVSGCESNEKWSYHITLSNYYADKLSNLSLKLKSFCGAYIDYGFDVSVYSKNRNMKCINQSKGYKSKVINGEKTMIKDMRIQSTIEGSEELSKHLILQNFDEQAINIKTLNFELLTKRVYHKHQRQKE